MSLLPSETYSNYSYFRRHNTPALRSTQPATQKVPEDFPLGPETNYLVDVYSYNSTAPKLCNGVAPKHTDSFTFQHKYNNGS
jgi:hypothetical protein